MRCKPLLVLWAIIALAFGLNVAQARQPSKQVAQFWFPGASPSPTPSPTPTPVPTPTPAFTHVIVIVQENQTVDHLFNGVDANISTVASGKNSTGATVNLVDQGDLTSSNLTPPQADPGHQHTDAIAACNRGYLNVGGNPGNGDRVTVTINGHAVTITVAGSPSQESLANTIVNTINGDLTNSAIVNAFYEGDAADQPGMVGIAPKVLGTSFTLTVSVTLVGGSTSVYAAPGIGGACTNDGFDLEGCNSSCGTFTGASPYTYVDSSFTGPYVAAYQDDGMFADKVFQAIMGPSAPAHANLLAAATNKSTSSGAALSGNPGKGSAGCENTGGNARTIQLFGIGFEYYVGQETPNAFSNGVCLSLPNIVDNLILAGKTFKYYEHTTNPNGTYALWDAFGMLADLCGTVTAGACNGTSGQPYASVSTPETNICGPQTTGSNTCTTGDIVNCTLPSVAWVMPSQANSDHPAMTGNHGPNWVTSIINAVGNSSCGYWANTAIIVEWDDWGGYYDHSIAPQCSRNAQYSDPWCYGFRVPFMVISKYPATKGGVDHTVRSQNAINGFIQYVFALPKPISSVSIEGYDDNLTGMFCYTSGSCSGNAFTTIPPNGN